MSWLTDIFARKSQLSEPEQLLAFLKKRILNNKCPICQTALDSNHSVARVASCNFNGPNPRNGFLDEVRVRDWAAVVQPFDRLSSMDQMVCEAIQCPNGFGVLVWVDADHLHYRDKELVYSDHLEQVEISSIEEHVELSWQNF